MIEFVIGVVIGIVVAVIFSRRTYGTLRIYVPDDKQEQPYLYVELADEPEAICKRRYVRFKVNMRDI